MLPLIAIASRRGGEAQMQATIGAASISDLDNRVPRLYGNRCKPHHGYPERATVLGDVMLSRASSSQNQAQVQVQVSLQPLDAFILISDCERHSKKCLARMHLKGIMRHIKHC